jgi:uncharacterized membrane protein
MSEAERILSDMADIGMAVFAVVFFIGALGYVRGCEKL